MALSTSFRSSRIPAREFATKVCHRRRSPDPGYASTVSGGPPDYLTILPCRAPFLFRLAAIAPTASASASAPVRIRARPPRAPFRLERPSASSVLRIKRPSASSVLPHQAPFRFFALPPRPSPFPLNTLLRRRASTSSHFPSLLPGLTCTSTATPLSAPAQPRWK